MVRLESRLGSVIGKTLKVQSGHVDAFLGIKYGHYRPFHPSEIYSPSVPVIDATKPAPFFPQNLVPTQYMISYLPWKQSLIKGFKSAGYANIGDLHLNVFRPPTADNKPVMVWIHGGGFYIGGASQFDPSALVHFEDVVVVCINYRLGAHGFAPEVTGNNGLRDQIIALEWVKENIRDFGGDPGNITIFGESAGGMSVDALVHSPLAKGLFHKAISQSGTLYSKIAPADLLLAKEQYRDVLKQPDEVSLEDHILSLHPKDFARAEASLFGRGPFGPIMDYDVLPTLPEDCDEPPIIPYMIGKCSGEGDTLLTATIPMYLKCGILEGFSKEMFEMVMTGTIQKMAPHCAEDAEYWIEKVVDTYTKDLLAPDKMYSEIFCRWWGDLILGIGPVKRAEDYSEKSGITFQYEMQLTPKFSHDSNYSGLLNLKPKWSRCDHCDDTIFMFGVPFLSGRFHQGDIKFTDDELSLSRRMMKSWADFAKHGDPGWEPYNENKNVKIFDKEDSMKTFGDDKSLLDRVALFDEMYKKPDVHSFKLYSLI